MKRVKRFFLPREIGQKSAIRIQGDELHHMIHVLRSKEGEMVEIFDDSGRGYLAEIKNIQKKFAELYIIRAIERPSESPLRIVLLPSVIKRDKMELIIQKATELGTSEIIPLMAQRSIIKKEVAGRWVERWQKIAIEASKQSGRLRTPQIKKPLDFDRLPALKEGEVGLILHFSQESRRLGDIQIREDEKAIVILIGPEGGWDEREVTMARKKGFIPVTVGPRTLRSETSAIIIVALVQFLIGDLDEPL